MRLFLIIGFSIGLSSCVSHEASYGPAGADPTGQNMARAFGYSETHQTEGQYILTYTHPDGVGGPLRVNELWNRRAKELCGSENYTSNIFSTNHLSAYTPNGVGAAPSGTLQQIGFVQCHDAVPSTVIQLDDNLNTAMAPQSDATQELVD